MLVYDPKRPNVYQETLDATRDKLARGEVVILGDEVQWGHLVALGVALKANTYHAGYLEHRYCYTGDFYVNVNGQFATKYNWFDGYLPEEE